MHSYVKSDVMNMQILMIDDDEEFCLSLSEYLTQKGFKVDICLDGESSIMQAIKNDYDLIILDVVLPDMDGYRVLKSLRAYIDTPILMLTAKGSDLDEVVGLEIGADDYIKKPCNVKVLSARINKILNRSKNNIPKMPTFIVVGPLKLDLSQCLVTINNVQLSLTRSEFKILECLASNPDHVCSKNTLIEYSLERKPFDYDRSIDVHISHLRKKINAVPRANILIETVYGFGYILRERHETG